MTEAEAESYVDLLEEANGSKKEGRSSKKYVVRGS